MKPVKLQVTKKTQVLTKFQINHMYRSDWKQMCIIDYLQSQTLFKELNGMSGLTKDSHFAYWIYQMFGEGEYSINAWQKGRKGFWNFARFILFKDGFIRVKKKEKQEDKEKLEIAAELRRKERQLKKSIDQQEREELTHDIQDVKDDYELTKEIAELDNPTKSGCYPILKSVMPIYKVHEYEDWSSTDNLSAETTQAGHMQAW